MIMRQLREIDTVAYIRFASVYRDFKDVREFKEELEQNAAELSCKPHQHRLHHTFDFDRRGVS